MFHTIIWYRHPLFVLLLLFCLIPIGNLPAQTSEKDSLYQQIQAYQKLKNYQKDTAYINLLYTYGRKLSYYNLDSLLIISNSSIKLSKSIGYKSGEIQGLINLGSYYSEIGEQDNAIAKFHTAKEMAEQSQDLELAFRSKNLLAIEYEYKDEYAKALNEYLEGIELAKTSKNNTWLTTFYVNTSHLYSVQEDYEQSIFFLIKATEINKQGNDDKITAMTLANLTSSYLEINDLNNATKSVDESITILENLNYTEWLTFAYELKADIYLKQQKYDEALQWFMKSEKIHDDIEQPRYKIPLYTGISKAYIGLKNYSQAKTYAENSLAIAEQLNILDNQQQNLQLLYDINKTTNNTTGALHYLEQLKKVSDTINENKNEKELRILKSTLKFDQEKERYLAENEQKVTRQKYYFYGALLAVMAALIIIFILKRNNKVQNRLNIELKKKEKHLNHANNTKSRLFSIIAHDLRGPISSFKSMFNLVGSGEISTEDFMSFTPQMSKDIDSISFTLNNLLSWGQTQMDGMVTNMEITNIKEIVDENISLLSKTAIQKSIAIHSKVEDNVLTWSDKNQISIVIRNLTSNALKFTPENGVIIIGATEKEKYYEINVKDTGIGLSKEALNKLFKKDETFTTYGTNNEKGTGLGLVLCKEMIENNKGRIWVESTLNEGTCFYFTVPKANSQIANS
ncbi:tetratricopeptide repeat-containing sensor histidine kinase [Maribacter sp. MAR_2009_72]|uniref:tetratricopeptide repeat-containing sensor histidine kinase n=1 Tax=Maribacter sp. MAR_2009_72 TaxID=1250050 RepID=UPI00119A8540|nr:tetratricopeptide repeat-containing sensor histidine kinase [Maribacter sp. MAR_2009_72]TVZ17100.1 signal transduction histidine kinase [Maribacter sp. MAR_2009_72]